MARPDKQCEKVITYIKNAIQQNIFHPGDKLPAENKLAETVGVSRVTIRNAFERLEKEGIIQIIFGRGAFVSRTQPQPLKQIIPFISQFDESNSRFFELYNGIQDSFSAHNLHPLLAISGYDFDKEQELILDFFNQGYRQMIIMSGFSDRNLSFYYNLMQQGVSLVFIDKKPTSLACDCVTSDNFKGGYDAAMHLIKLGHKRIAAYITQSTESASTTADRINGFKLALMQHNLYDPELVIEWSDKSAESFAEYFIPLHPDVTGIFCLADFFAVPLVNYIVRNNYNISVVGFDNLKEGETNVPSVTTVEQPFYQLGFEAAKLMYERIVSPDKPYRLISLPVELLARASTKKLKK